jgi:hypothetical protein
MENIGFLVIQSTSCILVAYDAKDLTVQSLTLVNEQCNRRMWLFSDQDTARVDLYNKQGQIILSINTRGEMSSIILTNGQPRGIITIPTTSDQQMLTYDYRENRVSTSPTSTHIPKMRSDHHQRGRRFT